MSFAVVTDSTADISPQIAAERGIHVVPLSLTIDGETMPDGTLTQVEFFERMNNAPQLPTTSQPSVGAFTETYERLLESAEQIVSVHISSKLSGTVESARQAAASFGGRVHVFDSKNLSWGLALQVVEATRMAAAGLSPAAALEGLERVRERCKLIVGIDSLDNLARGGRIGRVGKLFGSLLDLKVTFTVDEDGAFTPVARSRGEKAALRHTLDWVAEQMGEHTKAKFAVGFALRPERAEALAAQLRERFDALELTVYEAGTVICTHTGTGWGVALLPED
ncbi:MAG TPA: DegV family protein [Coriobacteriia bacterium]|nr:DegV family protein [Coriobacteriia bacterium]